MSRMRLVAITWGVAVLAAGAVVWCAEGVGGGGGGLASGPAGLTITTEGMMDSPEFGMMMACPAHAHGSVEEAEAELRERVSKHRGGVRSIYICRAHQVETLRRFGGLVDRVVLNPYVVGDWRKPMQGELYWRGMDHPLVNGCRVLRVEARERQLLATLDVKGEPALFGGRAPTYEEIEWMVMAALGSGYQGIIWRGAIEGHGSAGRIKRLSSMLLSNCSLLAGARPVDWATGPKGQPMSVLAGEGILYVLLLNPGYMEMQEGREGAWQVSLPLEPEACVGRIEVVLPANVGITSACTLSGKPVAVMREGRFCRVEYRFSGGGEILICRIAGSGLGSKGD